MGLYVFLYVLDGIICGYLSKRVNESRGYYGGFWWGFFFSVIGIVIVSCKPVIHDDGETSMIKQAIAKDIQQKQTIADGGWKCYRCGRVNASYISNCACKVTKEESLAMDRKRAESQNKKEDEMENIQKLKGYKELLDSGVLTQEEFDKKKSELLN